MVSNFLYKPLSYLNAQLMYRPALRTLQLHPEKKFDASWFHIYPCLTNCELVVAKITSTRNPDAQKILKREYTLLTYFNEHPMTPKIMNYYEGLPCSTLTIPLNFLRFGSFFRDSIDVLTRKFIKGIEFGEQEKISDFRQQQQLIAMFKDAHKEGFAGIDTGNPRNYLQRGENIYFIDFGARSIKGDPNFNDLAKQDMCELETMFV
jgi:hypothetical protein